MFSRGAASPKISLDAQPPDAGIERVGEAELQPTSGLTDARELDFVFVEVLVKLDKGTKLCSGILVDYELAAAGGLHILSLRQTRRKQLTTAPAEDAPPEAVEAEAEAAPVAEPAEEHYHDVPGNLMAIPYAQTLNLNLTYYVDDDEPRPGDDEPRPAYQVSTPAA